MTNDTKSSAKQQSEWMEENPEDMANMSDVDLLISLEKVYLWKEESTDIKWMSYYAIIEYDSDKTVDVRNSSVTYYDEEENVLGVSNQGINFHPYVIEPGEVAVEPAKDLDLTRK